MSLIILLNIKYEDDIVIFSNDPSNNYFFTIVKFINEEKEELKRKE